MASRHAQNLDGVLELRRGHGAVVLPVDGLGLHSLLCRYVEVVAMSDHAAERLRIDVMKGRPSQWLATQERLVKLLISVGRQLRLSPLSRSSSDPKTLARSGNGHAVPSAYELMKLADAEA